LHQKVFRSEVSKGYALVRTADSSLKGWVVNARLIWKVPPAEAADQPAAEATEKAVPGEPPVAEPPVPEPVPEVAAPEEPPAPADDGSSVFDPY
jgi:hypothetical protein